ncbi:hypothetical protein ETAA8_70310 [Anatilimnocola aggregata]|uniref:Uncharacterized protein n=1 Tax=Anatilimnocola aggregata TaxID=2528021 RepID=A0A517YNT4_9BACT|nr:hypothetical protein [Anatilimnocola aggregata]QDU31870.1 hypothetical protein ETAA8_70310 [Anatilimnocola aggregata]
MAKKKAKTKLKVTTMRPYSPGIQVPLDEAKVKVTTAKDPAPNDFNLLCKKGVICARGSAVPPAMGITLVRLHARIYRFNQTVPPPDQPPSPARGAPGHDKLAVVIDANGNLDWQFDAIPNAQCENAPPGNSNNRLAVWAVWSQGSPTQELKEFRGVCATKTDCE